MLYPCTLKVRKFKDNNCNFVIQRQNLPLFSEEKTISIPAVKCRKKFIISLFGLLTVLFFFFQQKCYSWVPINWNSKLKLGFVLRNFASTLLLFLLWKYFLLYVFHKNGEYGDCNSILQGKAPKFFFKNVQ